MDVRLVVEKGSNKAQTIRLRGLETIIGRRHGCDLRIPSASVSRRHCLLAYRDDYVTVEDLNSSNGTFLNGAPVSGKEVVRPGDRLEVGPVTFVVEYQLTQAAIDRLLQMEQGELVGEAVEDGEFLTTLDDNPADLPVGDVIEEVGLAGDEPPTHKRLIAEAEDAGILPALDADEIPEAVVFDEVEAWQPPRAEDLRDILSHFDDKK
jgi:hypothetical protein